MLEKIKEAIRLGVVAVRGKEEMGKRKGLDRHVASGLGIIARLIACRHGMKNAQVAEKSQMSCS